MRPITSCRRFAGTVLVTAGMLVAGATTVAATSPDGSSVPPGPVDDADRVVESLSAAVDALVAEHITAGSGDDDVDLVDCPFIDGEALEAMLTDLGLDRRLDEALAAEISSEPMDEDDLAPGTAPADGQAPVTSSVVCGADLIGDGEVSVVVATLPDWFDPLGTDDVPPGLAVTEASDETLGGVVYTWCELESDSDEDDLEGSEFGGGGECSAMWLRDGVAVQFGLDDEHAAPDPDLVRPVLLGLVPVLADAASSSGL